MELRVLRHRKTNLGQQLAYEAHESAGIVAVLDQPLGQRPYAYGAAAGVGEKGLLGGLDKGPRASGQEMRGQRGRDVGSHGDIRRNRLAVAWTLTVRTPPVNLKVWIWLLSVEDLAGTRSGHVLLDGRSILLLLGEEVGLSLG